MKNKIAIASAFLAAASFSSAEIVINDFLSFEGFVDMSYTHVDGDFEGDNFSDNSFGIDQVEISWLFDFDTVTAQIDLEYEESGDELEVEQAFVTYDLGNGGAITAGRYASMLGFEAFEPTGLYQFSFAYDELAILPGYAQGVKYTYEGDNTFFGISIQDTVSGADSGRLGGNDNDDVDGHDGTWGVEVAAAYSMDNGVSVFLGGAWEDNEESSATTSDSDQWLINSYVTFETGAWLFAAEVAFGEGDGELIGAIDAGEEDLEGLNALIMANFAYSDVASVTGRISYASIEDGAKEEVEVVKYTLAHNYAFTDNLLLVTEVSFADIEGDFPGFSADGDVLLAAVELLFSF